MIIYIIDFFILYFYVRYYLIEICIFTGKARSSVEYIDLQC